MSIDIILQKQYNIDTFKGTPEQRKETKTMTKAERIYNATRFECKRHIEVWGYEENCGFNTVKYNDNEFVCKRTLNDMKHFLERARKNLTIDIKLGILTSEQAKLEEQILNMVEKTIENTKR